MKRALVLLTAVAVAALPTVSEAAKPKPKPKPVATKRVVTWNYTGLHAVSSGTVGAYTGFENPCTVNASACYDLNTFKYETLVTVDAGSTAIQYHLDGDYNGTVAALCGKGTIPVKKGTLVTFYTAVDTECPGPPPTTGTVTITVTGMK